MRWASKVGDGPYRPGRCSPSPVGRKMEERREKGGRGRSKAEIRPEGGLLPSRGVKSEKRWGGRGKNPRSANRLPLRDDGLP